MHVVTGPSSVTPSLSAFQPHRNMDENKLIYLHCLSLWSIPCGYIVVEALKLNGIVRVGKYQDTGCQKIWKNAVNIIHWDNYLPAVKNYILNATHRR